MPEQHAAAVTAAQLSPDSRNLASVSAYDGIVFVWATFAGAAAELYVAAKAEVSGAICAAWLPEGRLLITGSNNQLVVGDPACNISIVFPTSTQANKTTTGNCPSGIVAVWLLEVISLGFLSTAHMLAGH